jgi:hypothetical protein
METIGFCAESSLLKNHGGERDQEGLQYGKSLLHVFIQEKSSPKPLSQENFN